MATRVLPPPDVFASCPLEGKVLAHYAGTFEAVYIALNPFIKPVSIDEAEFRPGTYPNRAKMVETCEAVSWSEVLQLTQLPSVAAIDLGLRTRIGGLREEFENQSYAAAIESMLETHRIIEPSEGMFPDLLHDNVLGAIQTLGYEWLWVADEFDTERKLHWIENLKDQEKGLTRGRYHVFTPDKQLLWTIHWDSHFSFLCSSREKLVDLQAVSGLEGFFCTPSTEVYWSVRSEGTALPKRRSVGCTSLTPRLNQ